MGNICGGKTFTCNTCRYKREDEREREKTLRLKEYIEGKGKIYWEDSNCSRCGKLVSDINEKVALARDNFQGCNICLMCTFDFDDKEPPTTFELSDCW